MLLVLQVLQVHVLVLMVLVLVVLLLGLLLLCKRLDHGANLKSRVAQHKALAHARRQRGVRPASLPASIARS